VAEKYDVVVIGGGTAGLVTASGCARLGRRVAMIEKEALGGDCLWTGCVPTKALIATAGTAHRMRNADKFGIAPVEPTIDPRRIMEAMRRERKTISRHDDPEKFRKLGIDVIFGNAHFTSSNSVAVAGRILEGRDIVIATGSRTSVPPVEGLATAGFIDHASFLDRDHFPKSVVILGGGYIGIEFAQIFRRFGCDVTVVEMFDDIIIKEDSDVIALVRRVLEKEGIALRTGFRAKKVCRVDERCRLEIEAKDGRTEVLEAEEIFVAAGRRGNIEGLQLDAIGVRVENNYVAVDATLRTNVDHIWACGDITGGLQFTHVAAYEAVKLIRNMLFPGASKIRYSNVPWALYTDPEVAHLGLTEREAEEQLGKSRVRTYMVTMDDVDRAVVDRATEGFVKIVADDKGNVLGAHAACAHASTLIEQFVIARKKKMKVGELAQMISAYPSMPDAIQKAASQYYADLGSSWLGGIARKIASWSQ
jgi:pyruvate/2-oxoglutarate dehydrogenase complex dihydrolipoamide dehydrogenase (E3) component